MAFRKICIKSSHAAAERRVSPHSTESRAPPAGCLPHPAGQGPSLRKLVVGNGQSRGSLIQTGMHTHPQGASLWSWGIRESLLERDIEPR